MNILHQIFALPIVDQFMVYNPLNGRYALLKPEGISLLKKTLMDKDFEDIPEDFRELSKFFMAQGVRHPEKTGDITPQFLGIIPSRKCNMACAYCDFGAHEDKNEKLDPGLMVTAIDWFAEHRKNKKFNTLPIQFFGGEPIIEQELVDIAVHHARFLGSRLGLIPRFEALGNGYYNDIQRQFIKDYFDHIIISLDGFQKYHDKTRAAIGGKSSFSKVVDTLSYFSEQNIELSIRCCITSESVLEMEEIAEWFCTELKPDKINFETLTKNSFTKKAGLKPPEPFLFAKHCYKSWEIIKKHGIETAYAPIALNQPQATSCPVGRDVVIVHPNGMLASCYVQEKDWVARDLDLSVGTLDNNSVILNEGKIASFRNLLEDKKRCENCFCKYGCAGGCHVNNTYPGSPEKYTDYCLHTRILSICSLLEELGETDLINELLGNEKLMQKLALQSSDKIVDYGT